MNGLMLPGRQVFLVDTHVNYDPTAEQTGRDHRAWRPRRCCASALQPQGRAAVALATSAPATSRRRVKMREALALLREQAPWLEVDGEMHGDVALDADCRERADAAQRR